ncbi:T-complex protein 1 subunit gamma-like [Catharus ustulatus]|uniref:T-complex protein 1 subunit gamma-like n=1 Tax=Catharus ustulatus TaxID=91951 RepID=UPI00140BE6A9|nr:T-complex protein 1 subunit gamma-like [Catharus ustulatus]
MSTQLYPAGPRAGPGLPRAPAEPPLLPPRCPPSLPGRNSPGVPSDRARRSRAIHRGSGAVRCGAALPGDSAEAPEGSAAMMGPRPVLVLSQNTKRESGRKVQTGNITAAKTIADIIRTCLGPRAMMKMLLDPMGGIVMTNDGNAILREIQVQHPAAKSMIEISRTQDEEVGDGTTSVIILGKETDSDTLHQG